MPLPLFEEMRWRMADVVTANPADLFEEETLREMAAVVGKTPEEFVAYLREEKESMTCPLCGRPSSHLIGCKGCGGGAFAELEFVHGEGTLGQIRQSLISDLGRIRDRYIGHAEEGEVWPFDDGRVKYAVANAYQCGGCSLCSICWYHTIPMNAYLTCPLQLYSVAFLSLDRLPVSLLQFLLDAKSKKEWGVVIVDWTRMVWDRWIVSWNTVSGEEVQEAVAAWRACLLGAFHMRLYREKE